MHDKTVAVLGLGRSGLSVCRALAQSGARTWAWDDAYERRASAAAAGTPIVDLALCNWARVDRLVLSPGIAHRHPCRCGRTRGRRRPWWPGAAARVG